MSGSRPDTPDACPPGWLVCSELHFNPRGDDDGEFIELLNAGPGAVNLRGARFVAGISFEFPSNRDTLLAPGERVTQESVDAIRAASRFCRVAYCSDPSLETILIVDQ